ncbi:Gluconeogenesis factor [Marinomonas gallaica]|uniref:Gluconeogenesis factor n=1 Tax=Marinomonas gallaica TaxID=1806667 RepID=A0A1C3JPF5_9GAMM|nr:GAK system CofD-like protein [Marinomonas gallaica]SBT16960.1 Gluconeogenesis factor [Marinomonas gallaica]SBT22089.1 Gluconeogenesis factor [Marinomonas gallaica]
MFNVSRRLVVPDSVRVHRYQSLPELAPSILFFSGGSALNKISRQLKRYTHHSIHMVTPFDSGGSSAKLRQAFDMPAVGDLRSRIMALADETVLGQPDVFDLFSYRLAHDMSDEQLWQEFSQLTDGSHVLMQPIVAPMKSLIKAQLARLQAHLPEDFDLRGASVGNLIISGGYLGNQQLLDPIIFLFSRLVKTLGEVTTIVDETHHLGVRLTSGECILGQHLITGKECRPLSSPIEEIWLNHGLTENHPISAQVPEDRRQNIEQADIICYPPGSFFTSVVANLLVSGVSEAIVANPNPKLYLPNLGEDPEQKGWSIMARIEYLLRLMLGSPELNRQTPVLNWILLDSNYDYGEVDELQLQLWGVTVVKADLIRNKPDRYDEQQVVEALLSFA